ncbi:transglycosylase SLT domain-containing protein [Paraconexibacter sp.]|uniref:transglycosylase SLT domain-containing protein n=1 Tax=Paraconexibacter sp. TaxID=2949640 RepID=UPI003564AAF6
MSGPGRGDSGQALLAVLGALLLAVLLAYAAGALAWSRSGDADRQRAVDLAALAAARSMAEDHPDVVIPYGDVADGSPLPPDSLTRDAYLTRARAAARRTASRNGVGTVRVSFPDAAGDLLPLRVRVETGTARGRGDRLAEAEALPPSAVLATGPAAAGQYRGPLEHRDGKPMRPDVARAYDRMARAARADGVGLLVVSGFRSDAEQAVLFARNPDPKWVAPPGHSLHRLGTELDLGPRAAYGWLSRNARRFGFVQRYSWEPWHYGFTRGAGTASVGYGGRAGAPPARAAAGATAQSADGMAGTTLPTWVPVRYRPAIIAAAQRFNVGAVLLAAQLRVESGFDPNARSPAGAQGIAQFMPATAREYGLRDPFDAEASIHAQARLMRTLLATFGAVPMALAAYNAGPGAVQRCRCAGPFAETRRYVATILSLVLGTGDVAGLAAAQLEVRLVR